MGQPLPPPPMLKHKLNREVSWIPKKVSNGAMVAYLVALFACSIIFNQYAMEWFGWAFGIVGVLLFFYYSNLLSWRWANKGHRTFEKKLFRTSLLIRVVYVIFSYFFYFYMTGAHFEFSAADVLGYHESARYAAELIRQGDWHLISNIMDYSGCAYSDAGYPAYLAIVYLITGDSVLIARLIKAVFSAWTVVLMYKLAQRNFGESVGRMTAILCMLMPNLIFYCGLHLKEIEMVFLAVLFCERADYIMRKGKLAFGPTAGLMLIPFALFFIRTALAAVLVLAFLMALLLSSTHVVSWGKRVIILLIAVSFSGYIVFENTAIGGEVQDMWKTKGSKQETNMEWRSQRKDIKGYTQKYARYASAAVFAPLIFTIPFPTMTETYGQENQRLINGGNFCKNITSFFTILAIAMLVISKKWRKYVLPLAILGGYLMVLVFSNFAHSERFHLPSIPFALMFAAYGMTFWGSKKVKYGYYVWLGLMVVAVIAWNWFKLSGRGMI